MIDPNKILNNMLKNNRIGNDKMTKNNRDMEEEKRNNAEAQKAFDAYAKWAKNNPKEAEKRSRSNDWVEIQWTEKKSKK